MTSDQSASTIATESDWLVCIFWSKGVGIEPESDSKFFFKNSILWHSAYAVASSHLSTYACFYYLHFETQKPSVAIVLPKIYLNLKKYFFKKHLFLARSRFGLDLGLLIARHIQFFLSSLNPRMYSTVVNSFVRWQHISLSSCIWKIKSDRISV